jgi:hypothetical protein
MILFGAYDNNLELRFYPSKLPDTIWNNPTLKDIDFKINLYRTPTYINLFLFTFKTVEDYNLFMILFGEYYDDSINSSEYLREINEYSYNYRYVRNFGMSINRVLLDNHPLIQHYNSFVDTIKLNNYKKLSVKLKVNNKLPIENTISGAKLTYSIIDDILLENSLFDIIEDYDADATPVNYYHTVFDNYVMKRVFYIENDGDYNTLKNILSKNKNIIIK